MALLKALKCDYNLILNMFIAVVAAATFILVCYIVFLPSVYPRTLMRDAMEEEYAAGHQVIREDLGLKRSVLDKIPDFSKQSSLLHYVGRKRFEQPVQVNHANAPPSNQNQPAPLLPPPNQNLPPPLLPPPKQPSPLLQPPPKQLPPPNQNQPPPNQNRPLPKRPLPFQPPPNQKRPPPLYPPPKHPPVKHPPPKQQPVELPMHVNSPTSSSPLQRNISVSSVAEQQCTQQYCLEFLTHDDMTRWKKCSQLAAINATQTGPEKKCRFIDQPHRDAVALVSFPGSGNTWVRGLLEASTGVCTGAVYCDISLRGKAFAGEHVRGGQALAVKTHSSSSEWIGKMRFLRGNSGMFGSAILLVRNPFHALVAEWNRKVANNFRDRTQVLDSHTKAVGQEWFGRNNLWDEFVQKQMTRWQDTIKNWLLFNTEHPVLVVTYEDLKNDAYAEVERMLPFLNVRHNSTTLRERISNGIDMFHRKTHPTVQHFTKQQEIYVNDLVKDVSSLLSISDYSHLLTVDQYIAI